MKRNFSLRCIDCQKQSLFKSLNSFTLKIDNFTMKILSFLFKKNVSRLICRKDHPEEACQQRFSGTIALPQYACFTGRHIRLSTNGLVFYFIRTSANRCHGMYCPRMDLWQVKACTSQDKLVMEWLVCTVW